MSDDEQEALWNARVEALSSVLGSPGKTVFHAVVPFYLGGQADVIPFPGHAGGIAYATADLIGGSGQLTTEMGEYELAICHRSDDQWGPGLLSRLARYTLEARLKPGQTMDIGPAVRQPSMIEAFLFVPYGQFTVMGEQAGLLLCLGITGDELRDCRRSGCWRVLAALKENGVYPFTDLTRASVLQGAV